MKGQRIQGFYMNDKNRPVSGTIRDYRMRYQELIYYVDLEQSIEVFGAIRNGVILEQSCVTAIGDACQ